MEADMQPEGYSHNRRDATMTPLCGSHRVDTKNSLLQKSNLGCVRTTPYDLPQDFSFTFGMANKPDGLTAHTVVDNWAEFTGTKNARPPKDFKAMNRAALRAGHTTAKGVREHSTVHDIRMPVRSGSIRRAPFAPDASVTAGTQSGEAESFTDLMAHGYRYDWVLQTELAENLGGGRKLGKPSPTKSTRLLRAAAEHHALQDYSFPPSLPAESTWKMNKFKNVKSRVTALQA
eukprot:CAMPEP_0196686328 /NCGR_PEP_ID=MMETSP1090-20130531/12416_1 /TAXON_ID=37098 /ORGANISM="Isochrysis sp, Strain CCMP1244" /LENGTH=231 /DNA_ID=CAMNT_0042024921 /DNA_START=42 /DNA_END=737 /DNA_ORIENTATION=+